MPLEEILLPCLESALNFTHILGWTGLSVLMSLFLGHSITLRGGHGPWSRPGMSIASQERASLSGGKPPGPLHVVLLSNYFPHKGLGPA